MSSLPCQIRGHAVEEFVHAAQDKTKNAVNQSLAAAFAAFEAQLHSDQMAFESDKIMCLGFEL